MLAEIHEKLNTLPQKEKACVAPLSATPSSILFLNPMITLQLTNYGSAFAGQIPKLPRATVYRTLGLLVEANLAIRNRSR